MVRQGENIEIIEWDDMSKTSFYFYGFGLSFTARCIIYPSQLIKTRLQGQTVGQNQYKGMGDAIIKIYRAEGLRGYYKGLHLNLLQIPMAQLYLTIFEQSKQQLSKKFPNGSIQLQHFIAGATATTLTQAIATPIDVITQYQQVSNASNVAKNQNITSKQTLRICKQLYRSDGVHGFYRGFTVATFAFSVHSALIWATYYKTLEITSGIFHKKFKQDNDKNNPSPQSSSKSMSGDRAAQIILAGMLASCTVNMITLPLDTIRTRHQLQIKRTTKSQAQPSVWITTRRLVQEEGVRGLLRGWSPRLAQSFTTSGLLFLGYEYLKVVSYNEGRIK